MKLVFHVASLIVLGICAAGSMVMAILSIAQDHDYSKSTFWLLLYMLFMSNFNSRIEDYINGR